MMVDKQVHPERTLLDQPPHALQHALRPPRTYVLPQ